MVFSSFQFVLVFLPLVVAGFILLQQQGRIVASSYWLIAASLFFYGWWNYVYLFLPLGSVVCNYWLGRRLADSAAPNRRLLILGIVANLGLLGYYKYAGFFAENLVTIFGAPIAVPKIALPLAISFCTFQQVSFLVDCSRKQVRNLNFRRYLLYIVFFPHLIAGPIVRHHELLPQLEVPRPMSTRWLDLTWGLHLFVLGLLKKTLIADMLAGYADPVFGAAATGTAPSMLEAWGAGLAYTFQLYFDFSGYADMAVGSARMFGIILPENFNSPYQAVNIADFWRRWHVTLSHFLRDYLYIPLGGNRAGPVRTYLNLLITMLLGGLWHGAAWTFVIWGAAHGVALAVNHWWRDYSQSRGWTMPKSLAYTLTLLFVIVGWVIFRAENWAAAHRMLGGMCGQTHFLLPRELGFITAWGGSLSELAVSITRNLGNLPDSQVFVYAAALLFLCKVAPNSHQWLEEHRFGAPEKLTFARCALLAALLAVCMVNLLAHNEVFIYYVF